MKRRANYNVQTLEDQVLVDATEAVQGINQLKSGIASLKAQIDNFSKNNGLSNFNNQAKQSTSIVNALKKTINFGAIYLGAKQVLNTLKDMTTESINFTETVNLFNVSFGKGLEGLNQYYEQALDFQERLEEKLGVNIEESMRYQALFNSMTKSMGLGANYAYTLSENMTKLGYDLASLYNIDTESAMTKLRAGLAGQTEPLRELGLDITEQSLKPILQELNVTNSDGELRSIRNMSQAEKTILRYIAVLKQAQIAQGDFARTMDSPANQLRIFNAQVTAFKRNMGNLWQGILGGILPYVNAIMMVINELLKMVAKLFGFEVSSQPVNVSASIGADDLSSDLGDATKKAKELKAQLMGFDEINNISLDNDTSSGSSSSSGGVGGIDQRLLDALTRYDNMMDSVSNKATEIRDKMLDWLGFERDDDGTWKLKEGLTNFEKILDVAKTIGVAIGTWKISSTITNLLKNLGILKGKQNFQLAFGITLLATGIFAQYKGTRHLLDGDIDLFTLLETFLGTTSGALGIVSILKATKLGKSLSLGNKLKVGFGVMLGIQGVQVFLDGINEGDIKKTLLGAFEGVTSLSVAFNGLFGKKLTTSIKNTIGSISSFGIMTVSSFKNARASGLSLGQSFVQAGKDAGSFISKGAGVVAGLAGITAGSALTYATMKDLTTGSIDTGEAFVKLSAGIGASTLSGAAAGSQFGTLGTIIGGVAGFATSAITAFMGYKDGINELNIPVTTLTDEINALTQEVDNNRQAHENAVQSIKDTYENQMVEAEYAEKLSQQLLGLVDANGKVKEGNEDRVNFILGELSDALGEEYKLNGNVITKNGEVVDSYKELQDSINDTVQAKKKEAEQTAITDLYKESLKEQIQLERDKAKLQEEYAKAEIEYNELMSKGLSDWTMEHDENCKAIIENYTNIANKLNETREDYWETTEDVKYYSQQMTDNIVEDTGKLSEEMITQQQVSSEKLQEMVNTSTSAWEETYNKLNETQQSAMLVQSTTLDNWSPTIEQKWKDMADNSATGFMTGISQVEPSVQTQILSSITTTDNLNPQLVTAWSNLANNSYKEFFKALSKVDPATQDEILKSITTTQGLTEATAQTWAVLAQTSKDRYNEALSPLPEDVQGQILAATIAVTGMTETTEQAYGNLSAAGKKAFNDKMESLDDDAKGKVLASKIAVEGLNEENRRAYENLSENAKNSFNNAMASMDTDARNKVQSAIDQINSKQGAAGQAASNVSTTANNNFNGGLGDAGVSASNWLQGFINKLKNPTGLFSAVWNLGTSIVQRFNKSLGNASPSKKTRKSAQYFMEGFEKRIKQLAPSSLSQISKLGTGLVDEFQNSLKVDNISNGINVNPNDFNIDTNQFIDYGTIAGNINTQARISANDLFGQVKQAVVEGMSRVSIPVEIEARADEGVIFTKMQAKAREYVMQTNEEPFASPAI